MFGWQASCCIPHKIGNSFNSNSSSISKGWSWKGSFRHHSLALPLFCSVWFSPFLSIKCRLQIFPTAVLFASEVLGQEKAPPWVGIVQIIPRSHSAYHPNQSTIQTMIITWQVSVRELSANRARERIEWQDIVRYTGVSPQIWSSSLSLSPSASSSLWWQYSARIIGVFTSDVIILIFIIFIIFVMEPPFNPINQPSHSFIHHCHHGQDPVWVDTVGWDDAEIGDDQTFREILTFIDK